MFTIINPPSGAVSQTSDLPQLRSLIATTQHPEKGAMLVSVVGPEPGQENRRQRTRTSLLAQADALVSSS
jgi:hypothetical protein